MNTCYCSEALGLLADDIWLLLDYGSFFSVSNFIIPPMEQLSSHILPSTPSTLNIIEGEIREGFL
jgi:hypothetical protein